MLNPGEPRLSAFTVSLDVSLPPETAPDGVERASPATKVGPEWSLTILYWGRLTIAAALFAAATSLERDNVFRGPDSLSPYHRKMRVTSGCPRGGYNPLQGR